ncbi:MAG: hypothetical protein FWF06_02330 [Symbiobacteriaceae bacterium]|nr:hypothetical protein [Symbiobacteriaceae bacterium]
MLWLVKRTQTVYEPGIYLFFTEESHHLAGTLLKDSHEPPETELIIKQFSRWLAQFSL